MTSKAAHCSKSVPIIRDARGRQINHFELYPLLGFKSGHHLPDEGLPDTTIQGVTIYVRPKNGLIINRFGRPQKSSRHRILVRCTCGKDIPFGRMNQHIHY